MFLEIKFFWAVLVGAVLAMGRFGIDPLHVRVSVLSIITTERLRGVYDYVTYFT